MKVSLTTLKLFHSDESHIMISRAVEVCQLCSNKAVRLPLDLNIEIVLPLIIFVHQSHG